MTETKRNLSQTALSGKTSQYRYPLIIQIFKILANALGLFLLIILITSIFQGIFFQGIEFKYFLLWFLLTLIPFMTSNHYADIITDEDFIYVQFLWTHLPIKWEDLISIEPSPYNLPRRPAAWVVKTKKFTLFHRLYGVIFALSLQPCFMLNRGISDFDQLIERIKTHLPEDKNSRIRDTEKEKSPDSDRGEKIG